MKEVFLNGNIVEIYESVESLPITKYMQFNRFLLIDSGIGGDLEAIDGHISIIRTYLAKEDIKNADKELLNMRQSYVFALENVSPKALSFVALIKSINGKDMNIETEAEARKVIEKLSKSGLTFEKMTSVLSSVKKKLILKLKSIFRSNRTAQK